MNIIEAMQMTGYDLAELQRDRDALKKALRKMLSVPGDHMTACDRIMGATHPCSCGADAARAMLKELRK